MRAIINTEKHIVQIPIATVAAAAIAPNTAISAAEVPTGNAVSVAVGSVIKAVHVEMWLQSESATASGSFTLTVEKIPASAGSMTAAESAALHSYPNKKNVLYTSQGLTPVDVANPVPILNQWIPIPKGKQRFGLGDTFVVNILATAQNIQFCGRFVYLEQT